MNIPKFDKGDLLIMKKKHPCGSFSFEVLRTGSDIRIKCTGCGHDLTVPRVKLEKNTDTKKAKEVISNLIGLSMEDIIVYE